MQKHSKQSFFNFFFTSFNVYLPVMPAGYDNVDIWWQINIHAKFIRRKTTITDTNTNMSMFTPCCLQSIFAAERREIIVGRDILINIYSGNTPPWHISRHEHWSSSGNVTYIKRPGLGQNQFEHHISYPFSLCYVEMHFWRSKSLTTEF